MTIEDDFHRTIRKERRDARRLGRAFGRACASGDVEGMQRIAYGLSERVVGGWEQAFRFLPEDVHVDVHAAFLPFWIENKSIAMGFESVRPVVKALRRLLRPYDGPAVTLYRGEGRNRMHCARVGLSWTSDPDTAEKFATDARQCAEGGSVILSALALPDAIVSHLRENEDHYGEAEYFVDPARLVDIRIHRALPQISHADHMARERQRHGLGPAGSESIDSGLLHAAHLTVGEP